MYKENVSITINNRYAAVQPACEDMEVAEPSGEENNNALFETDRDMSGKMGEIAGATSGTRPSAAKSPPICN